MGSRVTGEVMTHASPQLTRRHILGLLALTAGGGPTLAQTPATPRSARLPATVLAPADRALVDRAVAYLQDLRTARGRFIQTDARGGVSQGTVLLQRPGRARFTYDPPSGLTVVSNGNTVSVLDTRLRSFQAYPLLATPLSLFLGREINVDRGVVVDQVVQTAEGFDIIARDARRQAEGRIRLSFTSEPTLTGWALTDAQGQTTRVQLRQFGPAGALDPGLFVLRDPRPRAGSSR